MTNENIEKILDKHNVPYYTKNDRIYADSMLSGTKVFEEVEDMTGYGKTQLYDWLGY